MNGRLPNFIIGGAPKCGTTSLANYLRDHPQTFISGVKEPFYFADDMPAMRADLNVQTREDYQKLFRDASDQHLAVGEGSTLYLYSQCAIGNALAAFPEMKFIFMLRRPAQIAHAYHMQMRYYENESEEDFEKAWNLQDCRRNGTCGETIDRRCAEPALLQYRSVASIGSQLERAFEQIPSSQRRVFLFDDFVRDVGDVYRQTIRFLGLQDDHRTEFTKDNAAMKARSIHLSRLLRSRGFRGFSQFAKRNLPPAIGKAARNAKLRLTTKSTPRDSLRPEFETELTEAFVGEVEKVEQLLDRDLSAWKSVPVRS